MKDNKPDPRTIEFAQYILNTYTILQDVDKLSVEIELFVIQTLSRELNAFGETLKKETTL